MSVFSKVLFSYGVTFSAFIVLLNITGFWKPVEIFLNNNHLFGIMVSGIYMAFEYIRIDSIDKVAKMKFDKTREIGEVKDTLDQ